MGINNQPTIGAALMGVGVVCILIWLFFQLLWAIGLAFFIAGLVLFIGGKVHRKGK